MFVFTTTTKRKSPLQKQDAADFSTLCTLSTSLPPHTRTLWVWESPQKVISVWKISMGVLLSTWIRVVSSPCWINLTGLGRFCSPQTNSHLPKDTFSVISVIERGADGDVCRANPTIEERHHVSDKSYSIQHPFPVVLRDKSPGNNVMSPTSGATWPQEMLQIPHGSYWAATGCLWGTFRSGVPHCISTNNFSELLSWCILWRPLPPLGLLLPLMDFWPVSRGLPGCASSPQERPELRQGS